MSLKAFLMSLMSLGVLSLCVCEKGGALEELLFVFWGG